MPDATAPPLNLAEVGARINRHAGKGPNPRVGDPKFVDLSRLIDHDAPALLDTVLTVLPALNGIVDAAEDLLAELEKREARAVLCDGADEGTAAVPGHRELRMAILAVPAILPELPGETSCT